MIRLSAIVFDERVCSEARALNYTGIGAFLDFFNLSTGRCRRHRSAAGFMITEVRRHSIEVANQCDCITAGASFSQSYTNSLHFAC